MCLAPSIDSAVDVVPTSKHNAGTRNPSHPHRSSAPILTSHLALTPGTRLGVYDITAAIGEGGRPAADTLRYRIPERRGAQPFQRARACHASDGRTVATIGVSNGSRRAFVRRLDRSQTLALPGEGANGVVFSPDGVSVAIIDSSGLITGISLVDQQRKDLTSGVDVTSGIAWSKAGIIFGRGGALWVISPDGGAPRPLTVLDAARHEVAHDGPVVLPGEGLVLFASQTTEPGAERIEIGVDRWRPAFGRGRTSDDARLVADGPPALLPGWCGAGDCVRRAHGHAEWHGYTGGAEWRDRGARLRSTVDEPVGHRDPVVRASRFRGRARRLGEPRWLVCREGTFNPGSTGSEVPAALIVRQHDSHQHCVTRSVITIEGRRRYTPLPLYRSA